MNVYKIPHRELSFALLVGLLAVANPVAAQAGSVGEPMTEIWVDGPLAVKPGSDPRFPDAAADHRGRQVFVWDDNPGNNTGLDIFLRVFDAQGSSLVGPAQVNTLAEGNQLFPEVAVSFDGSFLVIWQSYEPPMPGDNFFRVIVRSQAYDADGQPVESEQVLSSVQTLIATDAHADVTALPGGGYVAVWESAQSIDMADSSYSIQGRRMAANGMPQGDQFQVNTLMTGVLEGFPSVTALADGGFLITWARPEIHGRRFMADATPLSDDFQINTIAINAPRDETNVATDDGGRILVVWSDAEDQGDSSEIRGRLYSSRLDPLGPDFRINTLITDAQTQPKVAGYGDGFFVIWSSVGSSGADSDPGSVEGRIVSGADAFASPQFLVNQYTTQSQENPGIAGRDGIVAMAWLSRSNAETSQNVIMGRVWKLCGIFCDSFE